MIQRRRVTLQGHFNMQKEVYQSLIMRDKSPFAPAKRNDPLSRSAEKKQLFGTNYCKIRSTYATYSRFCGSRNGRFAKPQGPSVPPPERPARFRTCSLLGTVRELRTTDFKQVRPRLVRARRIKPLKAAPGAS